MPGNSAPPNASALPLTSTLGSSLWLVPPPSSPIEEALKTLITKTLPPHFAPEAVPPFVPHMTITSGIDPATPAAEVLDAVELSELDGLEIKFKALIVGETYVMRVTLHVEKTAPIESLAHQCRYKFVTDTPEEAEEWAKKEFTPHVSLVYASKSKDDVIQQALGKIKADVEKAGVVVGGGARAGNMGGWKGGRIVLVNTDDPVDQWKILGEKKL